ncbi:MAG TPA: SDR family oxidoreductase [Syntrophorhabdaceae bacterium]|nr:SDR family oxidoreductase [Syntrophorhabdaceae bacterium]HOL05068.1 SDR family oxidoreductase [Syntrophorhabdaceae bacterium]HPC66933.1 SDR family oxidoreductase [Syntrophorhabdaceae bacterium]HPP41292.1 SDR family oxidoreductase [Syntrophorhabdaceae bacterium]HRR71539.1 SDR family oxidoreductase [Syntrophorhabdaceae bacterium]
MKLQGRVAILTAAAGAGIGKATARTFAREGATVVITDAHEGRSIQTANEIKKEFGIEAIGLKCDVLNLDEIRYTVAKTLDLFGRIDILFNNAGTNRPSRIVDMTDENWDIVMGVSLRSVFYFCREVLPIMMRQQYGRIISITSVAGFRGLAAGHAHYAAAKAGVMAFTRCLAMEAAPYRITANTIAPSFIYNEFIPNLYPEEEIQRMFDEIPYPRKGVPQDIANTALFLASDEGEYITGQTICVTGGSWMR